MDAQELLYRAWHSQVYRYCTNEAAMNTGEVFHTIHDKTEGARKAFASGRLAQDFAEEVEAVFWGTVKGNPSLRR